VQAGGQQQDLLKAQIEYRLAQNELQDMQSELPQMRAMQIELRGAEAFASGFGFGEGDLA